MSDDAIKFVPFEPTQTLRLMGPPEYYVVRPMPDGGFMVGTVPVEPGKLDPKFAAGTIQEVCEYLEDRFGV